MPVLRSKTIEDARLIIDRLTTSRQVLEITLTTPGALELIKHASRLDNVCVGAGTVMTLGDAEAAIDAGAQFLVSAANPAFFIPFMRETDVLGIPGAATPHEVWSAWDAGATLVKVFPAIRLGGADYIKDLHGPFPDIALMASGGVTLENTEGLLAAGCVAVGINAAALLLDPSP